MTAACDAGGATDICQDLTGPGEIECDLARNGGTSTTEMWAVYDPASSEYHMYGTDAAGNDFCCPFAEPNTNYVVEILGTQQADVIHLNDVISLTNYDLDAPSGGTWLWVHAFGSYGGDTIYGSRSTDPFYVETLYGQAGADFLYGNDGDDYLHGGPGGDLLNGGFDNDVLCGGGGGDSLYGFSGTNYLWMEDIFTPTSAEDVWCGAGTDYRQVTSGTDKAPEICEHDLGPTDWPWICQYPDGP